MLPIIRPVKFQALVAKSVEAPGPFFGVAIGFSFLTELCHFPKGNAGHLTRILNVQSFNYSQEGFIPYLHVSYSLLKCNNTNVSNASIRCAGAGHQNLCQSLNSKPSEASRQRRLQPPMPGGSFPHRRTYPPVEGVFCPDQRLRSQDGLLGPSSLSEQQFPMPLPKATAHDLAVFGAGGCLRLLTNNGRFPSMQLTCRFY